MGGGGSKKKQSITEKVMSDIASEISAKIQQNCTSRVQSEQVINIVGHDNVLLDIVQRGFFQVNANCKITQNIINEMVAQLSSKFTAVMEDNRDALSETLKSVWSKSKSKQEMNREVELIMKNYITAEVVQNCAASIENRQAILVEGDRNVIKGVTQDMMAQVSLECLSNNSAVNNMMSELVSESAYTQEYKESGPFSWLSDLFSNAVFVVILIFILLIVLAFVFLMSRGGSRSGGAVPGLYAIL